MKHLFKFFLVVAIASFSAESIAQDLNHSSWNTLLSKYVSASGKVNYKGFKSEVSTLKAYTKYLSVNEPKANWSANKEKAYWMNLYNASAISLVLTKYPVKSINDIVVNEEKPWYQKFIKVGNKTYSLDNIENKILRVKYSDARIHFGINCASVSCPKLGNVAFTEKNTEAELEKLTKSFVNNKVKNKIGAKSIQISQIFSWYKGDFEKKGKLIDFLNKYSKIKISKGAKVTFLSYNWNLNQ